MSTPLLELENLKQYFIRGFLWKDSCVRKSEVVFYHWVFMVGFLHMYILGNLWQYFIPGFLW
jgi:hypothetical protein